MKSHLPAILSFAALAFGCGAALSAQTPAERARADSLIRVVEESRADNPEVDVDRMHHAEEVFIDGVNRHDKWARAWYGLGLARLELARADVLAREGPELPSGMNNASGGERALIRAIAIDRTFAPAADALALAPLTREGNGRLKQRVTGLRPGYAVLSGPGSAAAAYAEREAGSVDSAVALEERALVRGNVDSAVVLLSLTRDLYRVGEQKEGRARLIAGAHTLTAAGQAAYRSELAWVASPTELAQWDSLAPANRSLWLANFWVKRDVAEGRREGARLEEHYRRIEYAMKNFRITLPKSGRQQFVTTLPPSSADPYQVEYAAKQLILHSPQEYPDAYQLLQQGRMIGSESSTRYYHPIQDLVSDKGIVWIRHGAPTKVAHNSSGPPFEIWLYQRSEGPLILYFRQVDFEGSSMPNELVPTLLDASPVILQQICHLDATLCVSFTTRGPDFKNNSDRNSNRPAAVAQSIQNDVRTSGAALAPDALVRSANRGKAFIDLATSTDTYHRDFAKAMHPTVQILGLDRADGGDPRMVIAFAIPGAELTGTPTDKRVVYPIEVQLMAAAARDGQRIDVDTIRRFATSAVLTKGQFLTGLVEVPVPAGIYSASLILTQADGRGAIAHIDRIAVPGNTAALTASDLALGRSGSGVQWNSGATAVLLNPLNAYPKGGDAEVYFQLSGLQTGQSYQMRFDLFRTDDDATRGPRLTISSSQTAAQPRIEVTRTLGLANLDPATYRVRLTVTGGGMKTTSEARLTVVP